MLVPRATRCLGALDRRGQHRILPSSWTRRALLSTEVPKTEGPKKDLGTYDYVIVGGGSAGCVLANRLSADPKNSVCLLEAGGNDLYHWVHIPVGYVYTMRYPQHRTNWGFATTKQAGLGGRCIFYPRGKVLGGCGSINGMIAMRGQPADYDEWARQTADESWGWRSMRPHFERLMNYTATDPALADGSRLGTGGALEVTKQVSKWKVLDQWAAACERAGLPRRTHFIDSAEEGVGLFEVTQTHRKTTTGRGGVRLSPYRAFVHPIIRDRPNLTILTHAHAKQVNFEEREREGGDSSCSYEATGLDVWRRPAADGLFGYARAVLVDLGLITHRREAKGRDELASIRARKEVILAAGAVSTPHLLQCSGIGDRATLQAAGVENPRVHLPGVGANLQDHLQIRTVFRLAEGVDTLNTRMGSLWGIGKMALEYALFQRGPMAMAPSQLGAFAKSSDDAATPDLQWHVQPLSLDSWEHPLHPWPGLTAAVCNLRPTSRGNIKLTTPDTRDPPRIDPNYLATNHDRQIAAESMRRTRVIATLLDPALEPKEYVPGAQYATDDELAAAAGRIGTSIFHPAGTTKMGCDGDSTAVLNSKLQVRDGTRSGVIHRLRVADCGVMPTITSGNTNLPTYAIAEKCARMILGQPDES